MSKWLKAAHIFETAVMAVLFGLFSYFVIYKGIAGEHRLTAYFFNLAAIAMVLFADKIVNDYTEEEGFLAKDRGKVKNIFCKILFAVHLASFKTALYLFYIVMLIISRISILEPELMARYEMSFIYSVEYGILLLIPLDKFLDLIIKDDSRILKMIARRKP